MADKNTGSADGLYRLSAKQLFEESVKRDVIKITPSIDIGLGGGIPLGCTVLIYGKPKVGKTTFAFQVGANAQQEHGADIFSFTIEGRLTQHSLKQVQGINLDKTTIIAPEPIIRNGKQVGVKKVDAEQWWESIGKTIVDNPGSVVIVDTISTMSSSKDNVEDVGYADRGGKQKLEASFCRKYAPYVISNGVTLILLTQIQSNTSGYGKPIQPKCGNAIKHAADVIMSFERSEKWPEDQNGRILGHDVKIDVECSALGPPNVEITMPLRYGHGIDRNKDVLNHAIMLGIVEAKGAWYYFPFEEKDGKFIDIKDKDNAFKTNGIAKTSDFVANNPDVVSRLEKMVYEKIG